eukprot:scaffold18517_cov17-Tisochrysis_lutea.AAC.1
MQECMMARPWPRAAMKEPFKEMLDQHGNFIFRGPSLVTPASRFLHLPLAAAIAMQLLAAANYACLQPFLKDDLRCKNRRHTRRNHILWLKIGISFGRPDSIQPDHLGRADYHGDCVNSSRVCVCLIGKVGSHLAEPRAGLSKPPSRNGQNLCHRGFLSKRYKSQKKPKIHRNAQQVWKMKSCVMLEEGLWDNTGVGNVLLMEQCDRVIGLRQFRV